MADDQHDRPRDDKRKNNKTNGNQMSEKHLKMRLKSGWEDEATKRYYLHLIVVHTEIESN